jgi:glycosyltransferase involved in cell wall biosynthesis
MIELSVVIATYNRADRLEACLDALGDQAPGVGEGAFEVVVVVDGSTSGRKTRVSRGLSTAVWERPPDASAS